MRQKSWHEKIRPAPCHRYAVLYRRRMAGARGDLPLAAHADVEMCIRDSAMMMTQAGFPCAAGLNLRIPARVAARHVSQIFGCAKYCALNACRSFSPKSFHRKYFGDCYHNVAKGVTALCLLRLNLPLTRLMRKGEPPRAKLLPKQRRREVRVCVMPVSYTHLHSHPRYGGKSARAGRGGAHCHATHL